MGTSVVCLRVVSLHLYFGHQLSYYEQLTCLSCFYFPGLFGD